MKLRRSKRPDKQFLWFMIRKDAQLGKDKEVGLDVGCSLMINKQYFLTKKYIGLDINKEELDIALKLHSDAKAINSDLFSASSSLSADFVQCIEVFLNIHFPKEKSIEGIEKLMSLVNRNGVLLINIGDGSAAFRDDIYMLLRENFKEVVAVDYGNFGIEKTSFFFSYILGFSMYIFPLFRPNKGRRNTYFKCIGKL